jgi:hypothetical protein
MNRQSIGANKQLKINNNALDDGTLWSNIMNAINSDTKISHAVKKLSDSGNILRLLCIYLIAGYSDYPSLSITSNMTKYYCRYQSYYWMSYQMLCIQLDCLTKPVIHVTGARYDSWLEFFSGFSEPLQAYVGVVL